MKQTKASKKNDEKRPQKPRKKPRCRHVWGPEQADGPGDEHRVCERCGAHRFRGDRYAYLSRSRR